MNKDLYILLFFSSLSLSAFSQKPDTSQIIRAVKINPVNASPEPQDIDTSLFNTQFYNPAFQNSISVTFLGNAGQAFLNNDIFEQTRYQPFLFHSGIINYFHNPYNTLHYNTRKPYTEIKYLSSGSRNNSEQVINALHTQNMKQHVNIGLDFDVIASKGLYMRQEALANRFSLFGSYDKDNYSLYASIHTNRLRTHESGGLIDINNFIEHPADDPLAYPVNLNNASSTSRKNTFYATQSFRFNKNPSDTTRSTITLLPAGAMLNHTFNYTRYNRAYRDIVPASDSLNFYTNNYYRINSANDSAFMHSLENAINISFRDKQQKNLIMAGIKHQFQSFSNILPVTIPLTSDEIQTDTVIGQVRKSSYNNVSVTGNIALQIGKFSAIINGEYFLGGYRANDIFANINLNKIFGRKESVLSIGGLIRLNEPDYFIRNYASSHFIWSNDFGKMFDARGFISLKSKNGMLYAEGKAGLLRNFVYFNQLALPTVKEDNLYLASFTLNKAFRWGGFNQIHGAMLQYTSDEEAARIPLFGYRNSTYYENVFFKKVLQVQLGFNFVYNTSFYSDAYMPALGIFYQQNEMKTGDYPYLDGFLNWKVKRTRFYLKYTNTLAGIAGHNYFTTYGYPMNWGSLKFGVAWTFYD